jgi:NADH-quinone oxidoreductase subunit A
VLKPKITARPAFEEIYASLIEKFLKSLLEIAVRNLFLSSARSRGLTLQRVDFYSQMFPEFVNVLRNYTVESMVENRLEPYLPVLLQLLVATGIGTGMIVLSAVLGQRKYSRMKMQAYECGMTPTGDAQHRFSVKFYLVAMLFILFDVEAIFLIPWAVVYRDLLKKYGSFGFWEMLIYIVILLVGFFYIWKKRVLDWNQPEESEGSRG